MKSQAATTRPLPRPANPASAQFVVQGRLARIKGRNILFGSSARALFALNDTAAEIWHALEEGTPPAAIAQRIARGRVGQREAAGYVVDAVRNWERLSLIRPPAPTALSRAGEQLEQLIALPNLCARITCPSDFAYPALSVLRHLETGEGTADIVLQVVERDGRLHLFGDGDWLLSCSPEELPIALKGQLLQEILEHGAYQLAVHAAALVRDDRILLLCGSPGAGKTTLSLALLNAGFAFAGDDVALLDWEGSCVGLPFAPAVKAGSWTLLRRYGTDLSAAPVFRRPDRRRVRYAVPKEFAQPARRTVGWVILLDRDRNSRPGLEQLDVIAALRGLLDGAFAPDRELSVAAFEALTRTVASADTYRLAYSHLDDAVELIGKACR